MKNLDIPSGFIENVLLIKTPCPSVGKNRRITVFFGIPGSGKSTMAKEISGKTGDVILSTDRIKDYLKDNNYDLGGISELFEIRDTILGILYGELNYSVILDSNIESVHYLKKLCQHFQERHGAVEPEITIIYLKSNPFISQWRLVKRFFQSKIRGVPVHFPSILDVYRYTEKLEKYEKILEFSQKNKYISCKIHFGSNS